VIRQQIPAAALNPLNVGPNSFLASGSYDKLIVEVQYVNGSEPSPSTISNVVSFLQAHLNKPAGISVVQKAVSSPGKSTYSVADITTFESHNRTQLTKDKTLTAYVFFADGDYSETVGSSSKVLGIAYQKSSIAIFEKTIKSFSGGITQPTSGTLESTVLEHEFGHVLGLVNYLFCNANSAPGYGPWVSLQQQRLPYVLSGRDQRRDRESYRRHSARPRFKIAITT